MIGFVRWTFIAVIFLTVSVQWISCRAVYIGHERRPNSNTVNDVRDPSSHAADPNHKHLKFLKLPDPSTVEMIKKRIKARLKGRKPDQSNERNLWRSHPKNLDWTGPDSSLEVIGVIKSLGI